MGIDLASLAAQLTDLGGTTGLFARLGEPSGATLVAVGLVGVLVGRFLMGRNAD
jgi:hypothetical protein